MREVKSQKQSREIKKKKKQRKIALRLYIGNHNSQWIERCREVSRFKSYQMELLRGIHSKVTLMDREAIEHLSNIQKLPRWIKKLLRSYRDKFSKTSMDRNCDNNYRERKLKRLDKQPSCREVSRNCRDCPKIVFQRREKHKYERNQACYSTKDPNNILSFQKNLSTRKCQAFRSKTHTHAHTLNKSNQFYILKTSQDSLVSIH